MTSFDLQSRPQPPANVDETGTLLGFLEFQRATFAWKFGGVDAAGMRATIAASTMSLGGLVKHLAIVEDWWFSMSLLGAAADSRWSHIDWEADRDWEWRTAADDSPEELMSLWQEVVERSRTNLAKVLPEGWDRPAATPWDDGQRPSLRWVVCHMIEEYARHNGHADLLRESVDGATGE